MISSHPFPSNPAGDPDAGDAVLDRLSAFRDTCSTGDPALRSLRARLAADANASDLLDVVYTIADSPIGALLIAMTPLGIVRVAFAVEDHDRVLDQLSDTVSHRVLHASAPLAPAIRQLDEYFDGRRHRFDLPVDLQLSSGFRRRVLDHLALIRYGTTESYGEVAAAVGNPKAVRAVGTACATNPVPVVVPCHRVVRSDGTIGNYLGGTDAKVMLLDLEAEQPGH